VYLDQKHSSLPTMNTTDITAPPFVVIDGIANFRDIGGYTTSSGHEITKGLAFRCADPSKATPEGLDKMSQDLGKVKLTFPVNKVALAMLVGTEHEHRLTPLHRHKRNFRPPLPPRDQP
jgi:hypothetical protein